MTNPNAFMTSTVIAEQEAIRRDAHLLDAIENETLRDSGTGIVDAVKRFFSGIAYLLF